VFYKPFDLISFPLAVQWADRSEGQIWAAHLQGEAQQVVPVEFQLLVEREGKRAESTVAVAPVVRAVSIAAEAPVVQGVSTVAEVPAVRAVSTVAAVSAVQAERLAVVREVSIAAVLDLFERYFRPS
jgi:hypothetical protein